MHEGDQVMLCGMPVRSEAQSVHSLENAVQAERVEIEGFPFFDRSLVHLLPHRPQARQQGRLLG
ncbi:MAG: hypothetical protein M5R42_21660 [Rhodocyclaceae bacterium]|nr:hypothetical protein [Rhodocyclaceae bacterium]